EEGTHRDAGRKLDEEDTRGTGPAVSGTSDQGDVVSGQDDVDDLLSSLGF
ncbi:MAG: protein phosphatase CheZ, partial [Ectothiorhodospira sp.]